MRRKRKRVYPDNTIGVRLRVEDYAWVKSKAAEADLPLAVFLREIVLAKKEQDDNPGGG